MSPRTVAMTATLLWLVACGQDPTIAPATPVPSDTAGPTTAPSPSPAATAQPSVPATTEPAPPGASTVQVFLFREHDGDYWVEPQTVTLDEPTVAVADAAMEALVVATSDDPGLDNLIPEGTEVLSVDLDGETLVVDLDFPQEELPLGAGYEMAAYNQIVQTGGQFPTVRKVKILEEGDTPPSGHLNLDQPFEVTDAGVVPVDIVEPAYGATVEAGDVTVSGTANTFEATVELQLIDPSGETVEESFTTAKCGSGCRGDWEYTFAGVDEPGTWTVVAAEPDPSDGEGRPPFVTETRFDVSG